MHGHFVRKQDMSLPVKCILPATTKKVDDLYSLITVQDHFVSDSHGILQIVGLNGGGCTHVPDGWDFLGRDENGGIHHLFKSDIRISCDSGQLDGTTEPVR